jgi:hypothetical protein
MPGHAIRFLLTKPRRWLDAYARLSENVSHESHGTARRASPPLELRPDSAVVDARLPVSWLVAPARSSG